MFFLCAVFAILPLQVSASWQPEISVGLSQGIYEVQLSTTNGKLYVYENPEQKPILVVPQGGTLDVRMMREQLVVNGREIKGERLVIQPETSGFIQVNHTPYRGYIAILKRTGITVVNYVLVEDYLYGVVPKEMPPSWNAEALRAQSVAARTFALKNRKSHSAEGFDLCSTSHCQVYEGMPAETRMTTEAVDSTRGEVLFYKGTIMDALFHADSGGMTESSEYVWGSPVPYLRAVAEVQMQTQPWNRTVSMSEFAQKLEKNGRAIGTLKEVRLSPLTVGKGSSDRSPSGRVRSAEFVGTKGRITLSGNDLRSIFSLPSTLFSIRIGKTNINFSGYGSGHGLGLSQWGAQALADKGKSYKDILFHYYTDVTLEKLY
jgi:spoIID/lytB domain protein